MLQIIRNAVVFVVIAGGALVLAGCTLGKSGNPNGSIYKAPADNSGGSGGTGGNSAGQ